MQAFEAEESCETIRSTVQSRRRQGKTPRTVRLSRSKTVPIFSETLPFLAVCRLQRRSTSTNFGSVTARATPWKLHLPKSNVLFSASWGNGGRRRSSRTCRLQCAARLTSGGWTPGKDTVLPRSAIHCLSSLKQCLSLLPGISKSAPFLELSAK